MSIQHNIERALKLISPTLEKLAKRTATTTKTTTKNGATTAAATAAPRPMILGLTGLQGSGKSTWASGIVRILASNYGLSAIQISLDDLYRSHADLVRIRESNPDNLLLRTRGQPGTHDEQLAQTFFDRLINNTYRNDGDSDELRVPQFDKSLFKGEGDRLPSSDWPVVPPDVDVVVFEGWCVGFQPLSPTVVEQKWLEASQNPEADAGTGERTATLGLHTLPHLLKINDNLARYCRTFMGPRTFDTLLHLDTDNLSNVYTWRIQQEHALVKQRGTGMSDNEVRAFVRGYMPAYELYLDQLRQGFFASVSQEVDTKTQIRIVLDRSREVLSMDVI